MLPWQNGTENTKVLRQEEAEQVKGIERRPGGYPVTEWSGLLSYGLGRWYAGAGLYQFLRPDSICVFPIPHTVT